MIRENTNVISMPTWIPPAFDRILPELKNIPNWVLAKAKLRNGNWTKPPYQPNGILASATDPTTWSSFEDVKVAYERGGYIGIGFVLDGKPHFSGKYLHGFDWDHCIEDKHIVPGVPRVLDELKLPRVEISISGTGIRGFFLHDELLRSRRTQIDGRSVELYSNERYMTTTGRGKGTLS